MTKTTIYLPIALKHRLERVAADGGQSEAEVIRAALDAYTDARRPRPRLPLARGGETSNVAEHLDQALGDGFGRT